MSLCDNNPDSEVMNLSQIYQCNVFYGNALYHLQEYHKAEVSQGRSQRLGLSYIYFCYKMMKYGRMLCQYIAAGL